MPWPAALASHGTVWKIVKADNSFISGVTVRVSKLERDWAQAAKAKGLKDPSGTLSEFRAEIAKLQK